MLSEIDSQPKRCRKKGLKLGEISLLFALEKSKSKKQLEILFFENSLKDVTTENLILKVTTEDFSEKFSEIYACLSELKRRL